MRVTLFKMIWMMFLLVLVFFGSTFNAYAEDLKHFLSRFYAGVTFPYNSVSGDFNGTDVIVGKWSYSGNVIIIPRMNDNHGIGMVVGMRLQKYSFEFSYLKFNHTFSFLDIPGNANNKMFNIDIKRRFMTNKSIQPYILFGFNFSTLTAKDSAATYKPLGRTSRVYHCLSVSGSCDAWGSSRRK